MDDQKLSIRIAFAGLHIIQVNRDYYIGLSLSPDLSARESNIGPRACPRSDIDRGLIDRAMTENLYQPIINVSGLSLAG